MPRSRRSQQISSRQHQLPLGFDFARRSAASPAESTSALDRRRRLKGITLVGFAWALVIVARLFSLQIADFERWQDWAVKEHFKEVVVASERGPILDRNGKILAVSVPAESVYLRPRQVKDGANVAKELSQVLEVPAAEINKKLSSASPFVWVRRQVPRALADKVRDLNLAGVGSLMETRRYYPYNEAASALIGKVSIDGTGLSGIEARYEEYLHTEGLKTRVVRDALGKTIHKDTASEFRLPKGGALKLTLDAAIQMIMEEELAAGRSAAKAGAAMAVMVDADTGEILGLSQAPSLNFNQQLEGNTKGALRNMVLETVFEPGSVMKPIVTAGALDAGVTSPAEIFNCEGGRYGVGKHTIKDVHPYGMLSVFDIVVRSSNIGMTKIGMRLGKERLYRHLRDFGFGTDSGLGLPGETRGILRDPSQWALVDVATHSFGQGVAVTPLQMVRAVSALANGGRLPDLRLVDDGRDFSSRRVLSEKTAQKVREMMLGVVSDEHGTGSKAAVAGVPIGGKTGTAQKVRDGGRGYAPGEYIASFVGFADGTPIGVPRTLTLMVVIDEPRAKSIYGGTLAAPVFQRIIQRTLHLLLTRNGSSSGGDEIVPESGSIYPAYSVKGYLKEAGYRS